jgi:hypothetical protein
MNNKTIGGIFAAIYVATIVLANWLVHRFGLIPVGFGLMAPAGVYAAGFSFPARDFVQRSLGRIAGIALILVAAGLSFAFSPTLAIASGVTFLVSESLDFSLYTWLARRWFIWGVLVSSVIAAIIDSLLFLYLAHIPYNVALAGQIVGKLEVILIVGMPLTFILKRKISLTPAEA